MSSTSFPAASSKKIQLTAEPSLITADVVALAGVSFSDVQTAEGRVYYRCSDPSKGGKSTVQSVDGRKQTTVVVHTPSQHNVRSAVHEYGGGSFVVVPAGGGVVYTDFPTHAVYHASPQDAVDDNEEKIVSTRIYPPAANKETTAAKGHRRFADFCIVPLIGDDTSSTDTSTTSTHDFALIAIMEEHSPHDDPASSTVTNSIVRLGRDGSITTLCSGHDFYAAPAYDAATGRLAYIAWDHPNMPWDSTSLCVVHLDKVQNILLASESLLQDDDSKHIIHGGIGMDISIYAPQWHKSELYFLSNKSGWYNLHVYNQDSGVSNIYPKQADFSESMSGWMLHTPCFTFLKDDDKLCATYTDRVKECSVVVVMDIADNNNVVEYSTRDMTSLPANIGSLCGCNDGRLFFCGGDVTQPNAIWCWNLSGDDTEQAQQVVSSLSVDNLTELQKFMSLPTFTYAISSTNRPRSTGRCYAYFYPPNNIRADLEAEWEADWEESKFKPPMLVKVHGGPTARTSTTFRLDIQFWTSRGFAVLDVDYGGSSGYGKDYQNSLLGNWGLRDVDDVHRAACSQQNVVNKDWICIDGSSAGGYTTLAALTFSNTFQAGASKYGIGDLSMLAKETHKFESRYMDRLIGPYPEAKAVYDKRAPALHIDKLDCPCILLQGTEDKVVPPSQAEAMFRALKEKFVPTSLVLYKGEQHGFRKSDNIRHALLSEYFFFCEVFGFVAMEEEGFAGVKIGERIEV